MFLTVLSVFILLYFLKPGLGNLALEKTGICSKGILLNETERVRYHKPTLLYQLNINGIIYKGNSNIEDLSQVGDSICIVYLKRFPSINRPFSFFKDSRCSG